jgi:hypothetical protein
MLEILNAYSRTVTVGDVQIGFIAGLEANEEVTQDGLTILDDCQLRRGDIEERDTCMTKRMSSRRK